LEQGRFHRSLLGIAPKSIASDEPASSEMRWYDDANAQPIKEQLLESMDEPTVTVEDKRNGDDPTTGEAASGSGEVLHRQSFPRNDGSGRSRTYKKPKLSDDHPLVLKRKKDATRSRKKQERQRKLQSGDDGRKNDSQAPAESVRNWNNGVPFVLRMHDAFHVYMVPVTTPATWNIQRKTRRTHDMALTEDRLGGSSAILN